MSLESIASPFSCMHVGSMSHMRDRCCEINLILSSSFGYHPHFTSLSNKHIHKSIILRSLFILLFSIHLMLHIPTSFQPFHHPLLVTKPHRPVTLMCPFAEVSYLSKQLFKSRLSSIVLQSISDKEQCLHLERNGNQSQRRGRTHTGWDLWTEVVAHQLENK